MGIPNESAVRYGREALLKEVERLRAFEESAADTESKGMWRRARNVIETDLLGIDAPNRHVIAPFDERWLDPDFRVTMTPVYHQIDKERAARDADAGVPTQEVLGHSEPEADSSGPAADGAPGQTPAGTPV